MSAYSFQDLTHYYATKDCWINHKEAGGMSDEIFNQFIAKFDTEDALRNRQQAMLGLAAVNIQPELEIRRLSYSYARSRQKKNLSTGEEHLLMKDAIKLADWLAGALAGNGKELENLAARNDLARVKGSVEGRGGKLSPQGQVWAAFCKIYHKSKTLPTKKAIREACNFKLDHDKKHFSEFLVNLGLSGLPK